MAPKTNELNTDKLITLPVDAKQSQPRKEGDPIVKYYEIPIRQEYAGGIKDVCRIEFPFVKSSGIVTRKETDGRLTYSIQLKFSMKDPKTVKFIENWNKMYKHLGTKIVENRMKLGSTPLNVKEETVEMIFKNPMYFPIDKLTGELIPNRDPSMFVKLFNYGKAKSQFFGLDMKPIDWKVLENVEIEHAPIVQIKKIYFGGGKCSLQMQMDETVVKSISTQTAETSQGDLVKSILENNPDALKSLHEQISFLTGNPGTSLPPLSLSTPLANDSKVVEDTPITENSSYTDFLKRNDKNTPEPETKEVIENKKKTTKAADKKKVVKKPPTPEPSESEEDNSDSDVDPPPTKTLK